MKFRSINHSELQRRPPGQRQHLDSNLFPHNNLLLPTIESSLSEVHNRPAYQPKHLDSKVSLHNNSLLRTNLSNLTVPYVFPIFHPILDFARSAVLAAAPAALQHIQV
jgi:hypothetical protein